jgi:hypothetical protein
MSMVVSVTPWRAMKQKYMEKNLDPSSEVPYTLKQLAEDHSLKYGTVRVRANDEGWVKELKARQEEVEKTGMEMVQSQAEFSEFEVRARHANISKYLQNKGMEKLRSLSDQQVKHMSIRDATEMVKLGIEMERKSVGIKDGNVFIGNVNVNQFNWHDEADRIKKFLDQLPEDATIDLNYDEHEGSFS